ncbi:MAG: TRAP transporter large permease [Firmicutes bacterium]|nr:TRAP transporter large permease [Bacillota bacterium]
MITLLIFLFMKVPVYLSVLAGCVSYFLLESNIPTLISSQRFISGIESISLLAIPFFVATGVFMNSSGITKRIMNFASVLTGRMTGGLAQVNVVLSTLMGGLSGSNLADAAMQSKMLVPEMEEKGFSKEFSSVVTATSSLITPIIPPGIGLIVYGTVTNTSVGKLFISGVGIGLFLCLTLMFVVSMVSKKRGYVPIRNERITFKEFFDAFKGAFFPLLLPVIIIGGIRIGFFTPTEAGSVAILYSILLGLIYKKLKFKNIIEGIKDTILTTSSIMLIVGAASALSWIFTRERIPQILTSMMLDTINNKYFFLFIINMFLIFVGMLVEGNAITIILGPLLAPIATAFGIDPIHFGMIFIFNISVGTMSPPMGMLMFITCDITKCKIDKFMKEAIPFYIMLIVVLFIITYFPILSTGLVKLFF